MLHSGKQLTAVSNKVFHIKSNVRRKFVSKREIERKMGEIVCER